MNLFREVRRRRSASQEEKKAATPPGHAPLAAAVAAAAAAAASTSATAGHATVANGHASLRRSLLPRSRTASNDLSAILKGGSCGNSNSSNSTKGTMSASASVSKVTDWSYCRPPQKPQEYPVQQTRRTPQRPTVRSASLGRNRRGGGHIRSITVSDFREAEDNNLKNQQSFSTFKQTNEVMKRSEVQNKPQQPRPLSADLSIARLAVAAAAAADESAEFSSLESLLDEDGNFVVAALDGFNPLALLDEAEEENATDSTVAAKKLLVSSLDSLESCSNSSSKSLPRAAYGSIQVKVQEIKQQLNVLRATTTTKAPVKKNLQLFGLVSSQDSPRSVSPAAATKTAATAASNSSSPSTLSPCSSSNSNSFNNNTCGPARPQVLRLPHSHSFNGFSGKDAAVAVAAAADGSCQQQRTAKTPASASSSASVGSNSQQDRLIFFFDIMNTQEKIAKVK